jgi:hypothetical protein
MGRPIDMGKSETPYALYEKAGDKWLVSFILILYIKNPGLRKLLCECMEDWGIPEEVTRNLPGSYDDLPDELRLIFEEAERRRSKGKKEGQNGQTD